MSYSLATRATPMPSLARWVVLSDTVSQINCLSCKLFLSNILYGNEESCYYRPCMTAFNISSGDCNIVFSTADTLCYLLCFFFIHSTIISLRSLGT